MEYIDVYSKDVFDVQNLMWVDRKQSPLKTWGTNPSDTWIMNMAVSGSGSRNYNTGYYNDTVFNYMIQDMEYISGSRKKKICAEIISKLGASSIKDMGKVMGELKKLHSDEIDFAKAGSLIKELLNK